MTKKMSEKRKKYEMWDEQLRVYTVWEERTGNMIRVREEKGFRSFWCVESDMFDTPLEALKRYEGFLNRGIERLAQEIEDAQKELSGTIEKLYTTRKEIAQLETELGEGTNPIIKQTSKE